MPQARPHSFKALAGKALTLPSEDSFPRPRGLLISPLSTDLCPPAASLRSCTGRWPPSTARTGEAPPLTGGPVCLDCPIQGQSHWEESQGMDPGWPHRSALTVLEFSVVEQGTFSVLHRALQLVGSWSQWPHSERNRVGIVHMRTRHKAPAFPLEGPGTQGRVGALHERIEREK